MFKVIHFRKSLGHVELKKLIELNDKYTWSDDQHRQLIIHNIQVDDEDEYHVRIQNQFGEVTSKAKLSCLIPPSISPATIRRYNFTTW